MRVWGNREKKPKMEKTADGSNTGKIIMETVEALQKNDTEILENVKKLQEEMAAMDTRNKRFLMAANAVMSGKTEELGQEIINMKKWIISLLDEIDGLVAAVNQNGTEDLKKSLHPFSNKIKEVSSRLGLEEIPVAENMPFDANVMEGIKVVCKEGYNDDAVVGLHLRGYRDKNSGIILRCAKVSVNKTRNGGL